MRMRHASAHPWHVSAVADGLKDTVTVATHGSVGGAPSHSGV